MNIPTIIWGISVLGFLWLIAARLEELSQQIKWHGSFLDSEPTITIDKRTLTPLDN